MTKQPFHDHQLGRMLRNLSERQPPEDLVANIMAALPQPPVASSTTTPLRQKHYSLLHSILRQFRILHLATACGVFALAFWMGQHSGKVSTQEDKAFLFAQTNDIRITNNAEASFLYGRSLLAAGQNAQALAMLRHAAQLSPGNPEYLFWQGTAYWSTGDRRGEQDSYLKALQIEKDFLPALVHLGHLQLENNAPHAALDAYDRVLTLLPVHQEALYNRALANHLLGNKQQSIDAWKAYLQQYRSGIRAYRAVKHLNNLGEFSYRSYQIGRRRIIVNQQILLDPRNPARQQEINTLARHIILAPVKTIELVVFHEQGAMTAKQQAMALKNSLKQALNQSSKQIRISWFGEPETIQTATGNRTVENGLLFFSQLQSTHSKEEAI